MRQPQWGPIHKDPLPTGFIALCAITVRVVTGTYPQSSIDHGTCLAPSFLGFSALGRWLSTALSTGPCGNRGVASPLCPQVIHRPQVLWPAELQAWLVVAQISPTANQPPRCDVGPRRTSVASGTGPVHSEAQGEGVSSNEGPCPLFGRRVTSRWPVRRVRACAWVLGRRG